MKKLLIIIPIILIFIVLLPILMFEFKNKELGYFNLKSLAYDEYHNIAEKQLLNSDFVLLKMKDGWIYCYKNDTIYIQEIKIPIKIFFSHINKIARIVRPGRVYSLIKEEMPFFYLPYSVSVSYSHKYDSTIVDHLNELYKTQIRPSMFAVNGLSDTMYVCTWKWEEQEDTHGIRYVRDMSQELSTLRCDFYCSLNYALMNYYVRFVYNKLPPFLKPKWFRRIAEPAH